MENRIKELRLQQGLTLLQLAEKLGVSESTVQRYESGHIRNLKYETMIKLSMIFGYLPGYVMGWDNLKPAPLTQRILHVDESDLLDNYQKLNAVGKEKVKTYVSDLLDNEKYKKGKSHA